MYYKNFAKIYDKFMKYCDYDEWVELVEENIRNSNVKGKTFRFGLWNRRDA